MRDPEVALSSKVYENLRVVLIFEDPKKAENFAVRMRAQGALVAAVEATNVGLQTAAELDPAVLIVNSAPDGSAYNVRRAIRRNNRLRWASLLSILPEDLWGKDGQGGTALDALGERLASCVETDRKIERLCEENDSVEIGLSEAGPSRTLRAISRASGTRTAMIKTPAAEIEIDFTDGLVVSAQGEIDGNRVVGEAAVRAVLRFGDALVKVESRERPSGTNIMLPIDEALAGLEIEERRTEPPPALKADGLLIDKQLRNSLKAPALPTFTASVQTEDVLETAPTGRYPAQPGPDVQSSQSSQNSPDALRTSEPEPKKKKRTLRRPSSRPRLAGAYTAPAGFRSKSSVAPRLKPLSTPIVPPSENDAARPDLKEPLEPVEKPFPPPEKPESIWDNELVTQPFVREAECGDVPTTAMPAPPEADETEFRTLDLEGVVDFGFGADADSDVTLPARPSSSIPPAESESESPNNLEASSSAITQSSGRDMATDPPPNTSKGWIWGVLLVAAVLILAFFVYQRTKPPETDEASDSNTPTAPTSDPAVAQVDTEEPPTEVQADVREPAEEASGQETIEEPVEVQELVEVQEPVEEPGMEEPAEEPEVEEPTQLPTELEPAELEEGLDPESLSDRARDRLSDEAARIAERAIRENNYALALRQSQRALLIDPRNPQAVAARARYHLAREEAAQAVQWAERAVRRRSRRANYRVLLGDAYRLAGNGSEARRAWQRALELDPNNRTAASRLGR